MDELCKGIENIGNENRDDKNQNTLEEKSKDSSQEESTCSICFDSEILNETESLSCGHNFHCKCIQKWLRKKPSCPVCRISVQYTLSPLQPKEDTDSEEDTYYDADFIRATFDNLVSRRIDLQKRVASARKLMNISRGLAGTNKRVLYYDRCKRFYKLSDELCYLNAEISHMRTHL